MTKHVNSYYAVGAYHGRASVLTSALHAGVSTDRFLLTIRDTGPLFSVYDLRGGNGSENSFMTGERVAINYDTMLVYYV